MAILLLVVLFITKLCLLMVLLIAGQAAATEMHAATYGKSVEDLVGVFSIQKNIQLGSSSSCYAGGPCIQDPQDLSSQAEISMSKDIQPPNLLGLDLEPGVVNIETSRQVNLTAHIIDDWGGISGRGLTVARFKSPSGSQTAEAVFTPKDLVSGSKEDGFFRSSVVLPKQPEGGAWRMDSLVLADDQGHQKTISGEDLARRGLPSEFVVS